MKKYTILKSGWFCLNPSKQIRCTKGDLVEDMEDEFIQLNLNAKLIEEVKEVKSKIKQDKK